MTTHIRQVLAVGLLAICSYGWGVLTQDAAVDRAYDRGVEDGRKIQLHVEEKDKDMTCYAYWFTESGNAAALRERVCGRAVK